MLLAPTNVAWYLAAIGEPPEAPSRSPGRGPPYWKSRVLRRRVLGDEDGGEGGQGPPDSTCEQGLPRRSHILGVHVDGDGPS